MGSEVCARLKAFVPRGKMLRGGLLGLSYILFKRNLSEQVIPAGAALELVQAGLLIHDDIMDGDLERRGEKSLFFEYAARAEAEKLSRAFHVGESLGICAGDIAFFLTYELLSCLSLPAQTKIRLITLVSRELSYVAAAQMLDVYRGAQDRVRLTEKDILRLYMYKTARYTFSLPLVCGAILSNAGKEQLLRLEKIGELLGIIFQIKDDEIGLFGDSSQTGKPVGSDIKEGKKNLYYYYLFLQGGSPEREEVLKVFGSGQAGSREIAAIRSLVLKLGIQEKINKKVDRLTAEASNLINALPARRDKGRQLLLDLLQYNVERVS
jgi:geranylgeranyl diphosphate synthase type I